MLLFTFSWYGCHKDQGSDPKPVSEKTMDELVIARNFEWNTVKQVSVTVTARDNQDIPLANVSFNIYSASPDSGGVLFYSGSTDISGSWVTDHTYPAYLKSLTVTTNFLGLNKEQKVTLSGNSVTLLFGGLAPAPPAFKSGESIPKSTLSYIHYMGAYNSSGVPLYLEPVNDVVDASLLNDINATLPEQMSVPVYHPEYLVPTAPNHLNLIEQCDVWITYITEGAGWRNGFGYFTFPTNDPPTSPAEVDTIHIIFPNLSNSGSNGGLYPGNKVFLGRFDAGISIGWVIFANGWNGTAVTNGNYLIWSIPDFNPESNPALRKHTVLLRDGGRREFLFAFEDWKRDSGSDQDFNDGVLYIKANPVSAVNTDGMPTITTTLPDTDSDGVPDNQDDYPTDPAKAYNNYYPGQNQYGTLAFEDLWPGKGDYDFNDLVVSYWFNQITNADNKVVEVRSTLITEAMGASYHNAFGFQMGVTPDKVAGVTGIELLHDWITLSANNTEAGQSKAVVIAYDDAYDRLPPPGIGIGSNTDPAAPYITPDTMNLVITFTTPVSITEMGTPPYNPFIVVDGNRNREVHLPDKAPTDLVDGTEFGTWSDDSDPLAGRYYKTATNLPWGMNIVEKFDYVIEKQAINTGYLKFNEWAESSGTLYPDWFKNLSGYRNPAHIYPHP